MIKLLEWLTAVAVFAALIVAVVEAVYDDFLPNEWYIVGVFTAILAMLIYCMRLPKISDRIERIEQSISFEGFERFQTYREFYAALENSIKGAQHELLLTHIRKEPPASYTAGSSYFTYVEEWAQKNTDGIIKRIGSSGTTEMREWASAQENAAEFIGNYYFKRCNWRHPFPFLNMAIVDRSHVFVVLSTEEIESTKGLKISDPETAAYFAEYFSYVWSRL